MKVIKCAGANTEHLPQQVFHNLFIQECLKEGQQIISMQTINNYVILAEVISND